MVDSYLPMGNQQKAGDLFKPSFYEGCVRGSFGVCRTQRGSWRVAAGTFWMLRGATMTRTGRTRKRKVRMQAPLCEV